MNWPLAVLRRLGRTALLLMLVAAATILLMRFAPGYFSDAREMDARYAGSARQDLNAERTEHGSLGSIARSTLGGWIHGDLGRSRQYDIPVRDLIVPRLGVTASVLGRGILYGWVLALCAAFPISAMRGSAAFFTAPFTLLLAVPTGALATFCLLSNVGGPVLVMMLLLASRDFKFLRRALQEAWRAPHLLIARSQGMRPYRLARMHVLPNVWPQMLALAMLSFVTALSAVIPVEVIFDQPGLGQLAWSAAMNRDLPVLMTTTMLMAAAVAVAGTFSDQLRPRVTA
jgi:peptide/nickel transport system permease protein